MLCGTRSSFKKHVDDDHPAPAAHGGGSPKQPRRRHGGGKANPYADRGLDKFSTVLSELEARRNRILRRVGASGSGSGSGLVMVRFVQSNGAWEPIIVKLPDEQYRLKDAAKRVKPKPTAAARPAPAPTSTAQTDPASPRDGAGSKAAPPARRRASSFSWGRMRRPACYWPAVMVLMLVCLAVFGRVFTICCTSIWWYLAPTLISNGCSNAPLASVRKSMEERRTVSPPPPPPPRPVNAKKAAMISRGAREVGISPKGRGHAKGNKG